MNFAEQLFKKSGESLILQYVSNYLCIEFLKVETHHRLNELLHFLCAEEYFNSYYSIRFSQSFVRTSTSTRKKNRKLF